MIVRPDVVVIGGGVIGVCAAYELLGSGQSVLLIEKDIEVGIGCSAGNAGLIRGSHVASFANLENLAAGLKWMMQPMSPFYVRPTPRIVPWLLRFAWASRPAAWRRATSLLRDLNDDSLQIHREYAATLDTGFNESGVLDVFPTEAELTRAAIRLSEGASYLSKAEVRDLVPGIAPTIMGGVLCSKDGFYEPRQFIRAVLDAACRRGLRVKTGTEVVSLTSQHGTLTRVLTADGLTIEPRAAVLCAGAWSAELSKQVGVRIPLQAAKGYHVDMKASNERSPMPVMVHGARVAHTPLPASDRFSGTLELSGWNLSISKGRVHAIIDAAKSLFPSRRQDIVDVWAGLRPMTPDGLPIIGISARCRNLVIATGHGMAGMELATGTARRAAGLVAGTLSPATVAALGPDRF